MYFFFKNKQNIDKNNLDTKKMIILACRTFTNNIFKGHTSNNDYGEDTHEIRLVMLIGCLFYKIVCFSIAKEKTSSAMFSKLGVRQKLNKLVLFSNV